MRILAQQRLKSNHSSQVIDKSKQSQKDATSLFRKLERIRPSEVNISERGWMDGGYNASFYYYGDAMSSISIEQNDLTSWSLNMDINSHEDEHLNFYVGGKDVADVWRKAKAELKRQTNQREFKFDASEDAKRLVDKIMRI